ncbi:MAG: proline racemase family protein [Notoacmeibacter sp.]
MTGSQFSGSVLGMASGYPVSAIRVEVAGRAYYSGAAVFEMETNDPLGKGFLVR